MIRFSVVSYNVNGIGGYSNKKRRKLFNYLHTLKASVILLQETHSTVKDENYWSAEWGGKIFYNHGSSNARGVLILFGQNFAPVVNNVYRDSEGRVLALTFQLFDSCFVLANIYAPNQDDP